MKKVIASAGLLALGAVGVQTADAQWAAGPEKPWSVSGTLRGFYDDNINTQPDGPGRVSSFGFEVRPTVGLDFELGPTTLKATYTYALLYYANREPTKIDQDHDFELWMKHNFNERYSLDFQESFVVAQEPDVLAPGSQTLFSRANGSNIRNTGAFNLRAQLTRLFGLVLGYSNTFYDYSQDASNNVVPGSPPYSTLLNRIEQAFTLDTTWQLWEQTTGILGYKLGLVNYTGSGSILSNPIFPAPPTNSLSSSANNNYSQYFYVGANENFRSDLSASARVGLQYVNYYEAPPGSSQSQVSPYADISLTYRYMDSGSLVFGFMNSRNQTDIPAVVTKDGAISLTQDQESATIYANIIQKLTPISPKLTATVTAQYQNATYNGGPVNNLSDNVYLLGLNLSYQFNHYISAEAGYNYDDVVSRVPGLGYDRNRVYIGVTASY